MGKIVSAVKWVSQKVCHVFNRVGDLFSKLIRRIGDWFDDILGTTAASTNFVYKYKEEIKKADEQTKVATYCAIEKQMENL